MFTKKASEPYVELATSEYFKEASQDDLILSNQQMRQQHKYQFYRLCFDFLKENGISGDYHEYGVHKARTFRMALTEARRQELNNMAFYAFDSFAGLPQSSTHQNNIWTQGALTTSIDMFKSLIEEHGIYTDKVHCIEGFYDEILTAAFAKNFLDNNNKISLATIDCDLYESAVPVFNFIENLIQVGTVLYIDDYYVGHRGSLDHGVSKAFEEFKSVSRFKYIPFLPVGLWGHSFIVNL